MLCCFVNLLLDSQVVHGMGGGGIEVKWHNTDLLIKQNIFKISTLSKNFAGIILRNSLAE